MKLMVALIISLLVESVKFGLPIKNEFLFSVNLLSLILFSLFICSKGSIFVLQNLHIGERN